MSAATPDPTGVEIPKTGTYFSNRQVEECKNDIAGLEATLADPKARLEDRGQVVQQLGRIKNDLQTQAPPETTGVQRDALAREEKELLAKILIGMPSKAEMRKCPSGAIGKHMTWERENKSRIIRWKNIRRALNRGNDDIDISNLEFYRGTTSTLNMEDAMIQGTQYFMPPTSPQYQENYERTFGGGEAGREEVEALRKQLADLEARFGSQTADTQAVSRSPRRVHKPVDAPCGKVCKSEAGRAVHEKGCKATPSCREIREARKAQ